MYLVQLKTALVEAVRAHFDALHRGDIAAANLNSQFANLWASTEFPIEKHNYPGIWVTYEDSSPLMRAGIDHVEYTLLEDQTDIVQATRWKFSGRVSFTAAALSSFERDRLFDEMVRMIAFSGYEGPRSTAFRDSITNSEFIALQVNFDTLQPSGEAASPGTPWGTDEVIYEKTLTTECLGEFLSNPITGELVRLSDIQVVGVKAGDQSPQFPDEIPQDLTLPAWNPNSWS